MKAVVAILFIGVSSALAEPGYGYRPFVSFGNRGYGGYGISYIGKREAEPIYGYGSYGYGLRPFVSFGSYGYGR